MLWITWAVLLAGGLAGRVLAEGKLSSLETELKAGSSVVLVAAGWLFVAAAPPTMRSIARLIAIGMTLGCLGDASPLLGRLWPDPQRTLGNMVLFGLGHVAYIRACILLRQHDGKKQAAIAWYGSIAVWLAVGGVLWYASAYTGAQHSVMRLPALAYTLLLSTTVGVSVGVAQSNRRFAPVAMGAFLFLVSDVLLAIWIFHDRYYEPFDLVWLSYGPGQMLIVYGVWAFIRRG